MGEYVMVPREVAEAAWQALDDDGRFEESCPLREALEKPARGQGEPVAWRVTGPSGVMGCYTNKPDGWAHGYKIDPLYAHADPGEVERLRAACEKEFNDVQLLSDEVQNLRAQLAERDALIEQMLERLNNAQIFGWDKKVAALSASAEPASKFGWVDWHGGECPVQDGAEVEYSLLGNPGKVFSAVAARLDWQHDHRPSRKKPNICRYRIKQANASAEPSAPKCCTRNACHECRERRENSALADRHEAWVAGVEHGRAEASAPVELDERAAFVEAWNKRGIGPVEAILIPSLTDDSFANVRARDAYWGWKARAALERKP